MRAKPEMVQQREEEVLLPSSVSTSCFSTHSLSFSISSKGVAFKKLAKQNSMQLQLFGISTTVLPCMKKCSLALKKHELSAMLMFQNTRPPKEVVKQTKKKRKSRHTPHIPS
jgi:hypothetical protein